MMRDLQVLRVLRIGTLLAGIWVTSCGDKTPQETVTLTLKRDGSTFYGTVARQEANSITVTSPAGDTRTFLNIELSDIKYGTRETPADGSKPESKNVPSQSSPQPQTTSGSAATVATPAPRDGVIRLPEGTVFPVRTVGFLDSCCVPINALSVGVFDSNIKSPDGGAVIPEGANVTMTLLENKKVDGRTTLVFELASADFGGRHYVIVSAKGGSEPGARATFSGAKENSPEAKARGLTIHLDDHALMEYKAVTPLIFKVSE